MKRWLNLNGFDINKIECFLDNFADKAQKMSYWNAAVEQGKTVNEIGENLASNVDDKQIAELLLRQTNAINKLERLIKAVENAIQFKYQPQIPEMFSALSKAMQSRLVELQQQNPSIGRVEKLMSAMRDENQTLNFLDFEKNCSSNEKLQDDSIANGKDNTKIMLQHT